MLARVTVAVRDMTLCWPCTVPILRGLSLIHGRLCCYELTHEFKRQQKVSPAGDAIAVARMPRKAGVAGIHAEGVDYLFDKSVGWKTLAGPADNEQM